MVSDMMGNGHIMGALYDLLNRTKKNKINSIPTTLNQSWLTDNRRHTYRCLSAVYTEHFRCHFIHPFNMGSRYGRSNIWVFNCIMLLLRGMFTRISILYLLIHLLILIRSSQLALTIDNAININFHKNTSISPSTP